MENDPNIIKAPWTQEVVGNLNRFQEACRLGMFHPFTCASGNRTDKNHLDGEGILRATTEGWECPYCNYTQDWCHKFMSEFTEKELLKRKAERKFI